VRETFDPSWLALREGIDHRSRSPIGLRSLREWWFTRRASRVLDLGCGTGSNLRYLAPRLPGPQRWTLLDRDAELLRRVRGPDQEVGDLTLEVVEGDLATEGLALVAEVDLVTASALLDLVSEAWLDALIDACTEAGTAAHFALSYDGTISWGGTDDPLDSVVRNAVNQHQLGDKGLGPALGPNAGLGAWDRFKARGFLTDIVPSPWVVGPNDAELAIALIDGWATAAAEQLPGQTDEVRRWAERRRASVTTDDFLLMVGHVDVFALPYWLEPER